MNNMLVDDRRIKVEYPSEDDNHDERRRSQNDERRQSQKRNKSRPEGSRLQGHSVTRIGIEGAVLVGVLASLSRAHVAGTTNSSYSLF